MVVEVSHPVYGKIHVVGSPYKYSASPCRIERHPPMLGEHTDEVLREKLDMAAEVVEALKNEQVV